MANSKPRSLYNGLVEKRVIHISLSLVLPVWSALLQLVLINYDFFYTSSDGYSSFSLVTTCIIVFVAIIAAFIKPLADYKNLENVKNAELLFNRLFSSISDILTLKHNRFLKVINSNNDTNSIFHTITQPEEQITKILDSLRSLLANDTGQYGKDIRVSIFYTEKEVSSTSNDWKQLSVGCKGLRKNKFIDREESTFNFLRKNIATSNLVYFDDKNEGLNNSRYILDDSDKSKVKIDKTGVKTYGSIYMKYFSIGDDDNTKKHAIFEVSTYGFQLADNNENAKRKIRELILPPFEDRIILELQLAYIRDHLNSKCKDCN